MGPFRWAGALSLQLLTRYLRVETEGFDSIPREGPFVAIANHSGFAGLDAILLAHLLHQKTGREPRILAHHAFFEWSQSVRKLSLGFHLREPHVATAVQTLHHGNPLIVFPEGEAGNFKSSLYRYRLQPFHSGFLRLSREAKAPIVPCLIIGAEETHFNLGSIDLGRWHPHLRIPLPLNLWPLPAKWKIKILPPLPPSTEECRAERVAEIQTQMQLALEREVRHRRSVYF